MRPFSFFSNKTEEKKERKKREKKIAKYIFVTEGKEKNEKKKAKYSFVTARNLMRLLLFIFPWQHSLTASLKQMILVFAQIRLTNLQDSGRSGIYKNATTVH